jgi:NADPH2:quinone reductase
MDIYQREGVKPYASGGTYVPGAEGAGTVAAVGPEVTGFAPGDRVAWASAPGSYAEQVLVPAGYAVAVPEGVDLRTAAAVMLQGLTAHYLATSTYPVGEGDVTVVHAAAGGVGLLLTQIIKMRGGIVVATTSTPQKAQLATAAGADHVAGYDDFGAVVADLTGGVGAAVVYDAVGKTTFEDSLAAVRPRGYLVIYGASSGPVPPLELTRLSGPRSLYVTRPSLGAYVATREELLQRADDLFGWIVDKRLDVAIGAEYPLAEARRAHEDLAGRRTTGKLLLVPG